ncbi:uncharacterized protein LOC127546722 [Antechinus flavipes]|uniref:uncharacterized protein LOC127546722 n=1 Tax=Antechinus flavipes TaxID=38775 RepID=UPI0022354576|nr:uncharacterized protein LOC127546722 [Antechinus flavipes]
MGGRRERGKDPGAQEPSRSDRSPHRDCCPRLGRLGNPGPWGGGEGEPRLWSSAVIPEFTRPPPGTVGAERGGEEQVGSILTLPVPCFLGCLPFCFSLESLSPASLPPHRSVLGFSRDSLVEARCPAITSAPASRDQGPSPAPSGTLVRLLPLLSFLLPRGLSLVPFPLVSSAQVELILDPKATPWPPGPPLHSLRLWGLPGLTFVLGIPAVAISVVLPQHSSCQACPPASLSTLPLHGGGGGHREASTKELALASAGPSEGLRRWGGQAGHLFSVSQLPRCTCPWDLLG